MPRTRRLASPRMRLTTAKITCGCSEWRTILQLVGVLSHGKLAKKLTDRCDRTAWRRAEPAQGDLRLEAACGQCRDGHQEAQALSGVFTNYLQRYGYLITFATICSKRARRMGSFRCFRRLGWWTGDCD